MKVIAVPEVMVVAVLEEGASMERQIAMELLEAITGMAMTVVVV